MPIYKIQHVTKYEYDRLIRESMNEIKIFPIISEDLKIIKHDLTITGNPEIQVFTDYWGNITGSFNVLPPHMELIIDSRLTIQTSSDGDLHINFLTDFNGLQNAISDNLRMIELARPDYIQSQAAIQEISRIVYSADHSVAITVRNCCEYIFTQFKYLKGITNIETTVDQILLQRAGVCQDFAHVMLQILRTQGIPSRYVSGYICPNKKGLRGEGATHAWVEVWIPESGWIGVDPTNNVWVTNTYVRLATGRQFSDCSPVKGTFKGLAQQQLSVFVSVDYEDGQIAGELNVVDENNVNAGQQSTANRQRAEDQHSQ
jgi:transglutaminase-like putative cysteine protease